MALDRASFEALFRAHAAHVYAIGMRITGDRATAEDVVQETFVKAYTAADTTVFDDIGAWLGTVARNASLNAIRNRARTVGLAEEPGDGAPAAPGIVIADGSAAADPARAAASSDAVRGVWELVDELRPEARAALVLRYSEDLPIDRIALVLGKSRNATTVLLHRARAALRAAYATRVFARAELPDACRARRAEIVDLVARRPVTDELRDHVAACLHCQESVDELRGMTRAFAVAPMVAVPATLGARVAAALAAAGTAAGAGSGAAVGTAGAAGLSAAGGSGSAGTAAGVGLSAAGAGGAAATGAASVAGGGLVAGVVQAAVASLAVVAVVATMAIAIGGIGRAGAETPTAAPAADVHAEAARGPLGPSLRLVAAATATPDGAPAATAAPATADPASVPVATGTGPRESGASGATATPPPGAAPRSTPAPRGTPVPTPTPIVTPVATPTPTPVGTPEPTPTPRRGNAGSIWAAGPSCGSTALRFAAGDVVWVTVRGFEPDAVVRWRITAQPGSRPARFERTGTLVVGGDGSACAPVWTVPGVADASGLFRIVVGGKQKVVGINSR